MTLRFDAHAVRAPASFGLVLAASLAGACGRDSLSIIDADASHPSDASLAEPDAQRTVDARKDALSEQAEQAEEVGDELRNRDDADALSDAGQEQQDRTDAAEDVRSDRSPLEDADVSADAGITFSFLPSHTTAAIPATAGVDLSDVVAIDTTSLTLTFDAGITPVAVRFEVDSGDNAVLYAGAWHVNRPVAVTGARRFIALATGPVVIDALLDGSAKGQTPGPGGHVPAVAGGMAGTGDGTAGSTLSAGGGGGFGSPGAHGGGTSASGGATFGDLLGDFSGGASGGRGGTIMNAVCLGAALGGAGGGAIQISAADSIVVDAAGGINVGGGGGGAGCAIGPGPFGGGGGSGGTIFLESPSIAVSGWLAANGGGGGYTSVGLDGQLSATPAGNGAAGAGPSLTAAQPGGPAGVVTDGASGGGGGAGRIWLRTRGNAAMQNTLQVSPRARSDVTI